MTLNMTESIVKTLKEHDDDISKIKSGYVPLQSRVLVYVASPYTKGNQTDNVRRSLMVGKWMREPIWKISAKVVPKIEVYLPLLSHFDELLNPRPYEDWLTMCLDFIIPRCDVLMRINGPSEGSDREVARAKQLFKPTFVMAENSVMTDQEFAFYVKKEILKQYENG